VGRTSGAKRRELVNSATRPASDGELVDALIAFVNGAEVVLSGSNDPRATTEERSHFGEFLRLAVEDPDRLPLQEITQHVLASLKVHPVIVMHGHGLALDYFREFPDLPTALTYATLLLLDARQPYGAALCRCKLPRCGKYYLAKKQKKGGPANRTYCSPRHRIEQHNSAERKAASKPPRRHK
jgi:hypothetical protein